MIADSGKYARAKEKYKVNGKYNRFNKLKRQREAIPNGQSSLIYRRSFKGAGLVRHSTSNIEVCPSHSSKRCAPASPAKKLTALGSYGHSP